jgi:hypothetical protein
MREAWEETEMPGFDQLPPDPPEVTLTPEQEAAVELYTGGGGAGDSGFHSSNPLFNMRCLLH